jgi:hypothetical protein
MWRGRNNTVRLDGAGGQFVILIPGKDAIVIFTAGPRIAQHLLDLVHNYLIPSIISDKPLAGDQEVYGNLLRKEAALSIKPPFPASSESDFETKISGKEFILGENSFDIQSVYFTFRDGECDLTVKKDNNISLLKAGLDTWITVSAKLGYLLATPRFSSIMNIDANYEVPQSIMKMAARYSWTSSNTLELTVRVVEESIGSRTLVCSFSEFNRMIFMTVRQTTGGLAMPGEAQQDTTLTGTLLEVE